MKSLSDYRVSARESLNTKWVSFVLVTFIVLFIESILGGVSLTTDDSLLPWLYISNPTWIFVGSGLTLAGLILVGLPLELAFNILFLRSNRDSSLQQMVGELFRIFGQRYEQGVVAMLLSKLLISLLGIVTLGIGAIILGLAYAMLPFVIEDDPTLSSTEVMRISRHIMRGHKWDLFCLYLSFIGWFILSCCTFGIGFLWLIPYVRSTVAHFYEDVKTEYISSGVETR